MTNDQSELRRRNIILALAFGGFALLVFATSFPFWSGLFRLMGNQVQ